MVPALRRVSFRVAWRLARLLHRLDFALLLPALGRMPISLGHRIAAWRGQVNAATGRDWRSMGLGFRHIRPQSARGYEALPLAAPAALVQRWVRERFVTEAREEYEARLVAAHRVGELQCEVVPADGLSGLVNRERGLVLLTPHFESFFLGVAFLARCGAKVNLMTSAVTHDPRVDAAVQRHFTAKYRGLEAFLNGGKAIDLEQGARPFYRMLQNREIVVILGDAPVLPDGVAMTVGFLGGERRLSGGPLRMARSTGSDLGGFLCRHLDGNRYRLELGPVGAADDPATVSDVYRFFSRAILERPGGWWAADLLPAMPLVPTTDVPAAAPEAIPAAAGTPPLMHQTLVLTDSPLAGSQELAHGLRQLRGRLRGGPDDEWREATAAEARPADLLPLCTQPHLLVLLQPALLATADLPRELHAGLQASGAVCALAADQRGATGEWAIGYTSTVDFERYVARRQGLPRSAPWEGALPYAYLVEVAGAREVVARQPGLGWHDLPAAFGARTVVAPRAFVHSYSDYQQGARGEMLDLLPTGVQRLLDVGGGEGRFARAFVEQRGGEAWLVEPGEAARKVQAHDRLHVFQGKLDQVDPAQCGLFDAVSFLDVLEHMEQPLDALRAARRLLRPQGLLLVSVPNVGHWSVVRDLALGRFDYSPVGILCHTHLRFFTARSLQEMLGEAGFEITQLRRAGPPMPEDFARFLAASAQAHLAWDTESLRTESLHVVATLR